MGNLERLADRWTREAPVVAYLEDGLAPEDAAALEARVAGLPHAAGVVRVTKEEALARLRDAAGPEDAWLIEGLEGDNPLPESLEVRLVSDPGAEERIAELAGRLAALPGVAEVSGGGPWLAAFLRLRDAGRWAGLLVGAASLGAAALVLSNTIRLAVYARGREIRILQTVGAGDGLIRLPFMIEGAFQALAGFALGAAALRGALLLLERRHAWLAGAEFPGAAALLALAAAFAGVGIATSLLAVERRLRERP